MGNPVPPVPVLPRRGKPVYVPPSPTSWNYIQSTGELFRPDGTLCANGYSGVGDGKNNPAMQEAHNVGPLPVGFYRLGEVTDEKGPLTIRLNPDPINVMFGRDGFLIHGDNVKHDGTASHGCIIMPNAAREELAKVGGVVRVLSQPTMPPEKLA